MEPPEIYHDSSQGDFPILDFTFRNDGVRSDLITAVEFHLTNVKIDRQPILEYDILCNNGDLVLAIFNYGWGPARNVTARLNLSFPATSTTVEIPNVFSLGDVYPTYKYRGSNSPRKLRILNREHVNIPKVPNRLIAEESWRGYFAFAKDYWYMGKVDRQKIASLPGLKKPPLELKYKDEKGELVVNNLRPGRWEKSRYFFSKQEGFVIVHYGLKDDVHCSLIKPSCRYHFLISTERPKPIYSISTAQSILPSGYERLWIVLGADKSCVLEGKIVFRTSSGREIISPPIQVNLCNPSNSAFYALLKGNHNRQRDEEWPDKKGQLARKFKNVRNIAIPSWQREDRLFTKYQDWIDSATSYRDWPYDDSE